MRNPVSIQCMVMAFQHNSVPPYTQFQSIGIMRELEASQGSSTDELRVLHVIPGDGRGAAFVFARRQIESLVDAGVNVRAFFLSRSSPLVLPREWRRLHSEIRQFRPTLLHAQFGGVTAFISAVGTTVPLIITFQGSDLNYNPDLGPIHRFISHFLSQVACLRARRIITVSHQLRTRLWWHRGRTAVIPTGVNLSLFRPIAQEEARNVLGWQQHIPIVVFNAGGRPRLKGTQFLQAAVRIAGDIVGPVHLMMLNGDVPGDLVPYWINAADCVALASVNEGSPNIIKEALACNIPVVATDVGDVAERLENVKPSRVVRREVAEFGEALASILRERRATNGREKVSLLSEHRIAQAIRAIYEEALQREKLNHEL